MKRFALITVLAAAFMAFGVTPLWTGPAASFDVTPAYSIDDILKNPKAFLDVGVKLTCQFNEFGKIYSPFYTRFVPDQYLNLSVWDDSKNLWVKEDFKKSFQFLFINKKNLHIVEMLRLKKFARFEAVAIIRNNFNKTPWIEIVELNLLDEHLTKESLLRISRGLKLMEEGFYSKAYKEFKLLEADEAVPFRIKLFVMKHLGICAYHTKAFKKARIFLQKVYRHTLKDKEVEEYLEKAIQAEELLLKESG